MVKSLSTFNSDKLPKACIIASIMVILTLFGVGSYLNAVDALPAPMLTGHPALDEKLRFLRNNRYVRDVQLAAIGSSEGVDNLSTEVMKKIPVLGQNYFNFAIRNYQMFGVIKYWEILSQIYHPKAMIICLNPLSFRWDMDAHFPEKDIIDYLNGKNPLPFYLKYRGIYFFRRILTVGRLRKSNYSFRTLNFDEGGGANISDFHEPPYKGNWNKRLKTELNPKSYEVLDNMLSKFEKEGVEVIYVVSPMRKYFLDDKKVQMQARQHWDKVKSLLDKHGMAFINMHEKLSFDDQYFADAIHLNKTGSVIFTKKLVEEIVKRKYISSISGK